MTAKIQGGALLLARKAFDGWLWTLTGNQIKIFLWLLFRARWKQGSERWFDGTEFVEVTRGQLVTSPDAIAKANGVSRGCVRRTVGSLIKADTIRATSRAGRYTIITVCNYDTYQDPENYADLARSHLRAYREPGESQVRATEENQGIRESGIRNPPTPRKRGAPTPDARPGNGTGPRPETRAMRRERERLAVDTVTDPDWRRETDIQRQSRERRKELQLAIAAEHPDWRQGAINSEVSKRWKAEGWEERIEDPIAAYGELPT
jgi:hypothetical protein